MIVNLVGKGPGVCVQAKSVVEAPGCYRLRLQVGGHLTGARPLPAQVRSGRRRRGADPRLERLEGHLLRRGRRWMRPGVGRVRESGGCRSWATHCGSGRVGSRD